MFSGSIGFALMLTYPSVQSYIGGSYVGPLTRGATEFVYDTRAASSRDNVFEPKEGANAYVITQHQSGVHVRVIFSQE